MGAIGGVAAGPTAPAAASCSHAHPDKADNGPLRVTGSGVAMRTGPHLGCRVVDRFDNHSYMSPWCYTEGDWVTRGNASMQTWSFVSLAALGEPSGWMSDLYLEHNGANVHC